MTSLQLILAMNCPLVVTAPPGLPSGPFTGLSCGFLARLSKVASEIIDVSALESILNNICNIWCICNVQCGVQWWLFICDNYIYTHLILGEWPQKDWLVLTFAVIFCGLSHTLCETCYSKVSYFLACVASFPIRWTLVENTVVMVASSPFSFHSLIFMHVCFRCTGTVAPLFLLFE